MRYRTRRSRRGNLRLQPNLIYRSYQVFMEIHDPTQVDRQGPDIGNQYRSEIFYTTDEQKKAAEEVIKILRERGYNVATKITAAKTFYRAEEYHQSYYLKKGGQPYCHSYVKRF